MKRFLFLALLVIGLTGCDLSSLKRKTIDVRAKQYVLVAVNRPKHFYIRLRDIETGRVTSELYVSKHCNSWRKARIGEVLTFNEVTYEYGDGSRTIGVNVKNFCEILRKR